MKKDTAIKIFGTVNGTAEAMQMTRAAIHTWPNNLSVSQSDRVIGAAIRLGVEIPNEALKEIKNDYAKKLRSP